MDYRKLHDELTTDPLGIGYAAMIARGDLSAVADAINDPTRERSRGAVPASEVFEAIAPDDFAALDAGALARLGVILELGAVDLGGANTAASLEGVFGKGATVDALKVLGTLTISRGEELGLGKVEPGDVKMALGGRW